MNYAKEKIHPDKSRGQNFLVDEKVLAKIVEAAELKKSDRVIEIGAGTGILTKELAARVKKVIAFEIDKKLTPFLRGRLKNFGNVEIREEDILDVKKPLSADGQALNYKIVANIPYNITSAILEKFLATPNKPSLMVLLVQKEVAERVCALPGEMSLLSVMVQYYGQPKIVKIVPSSAFYPQPKVESAILKIIINRHPELVSGSHKMLIRQLAEVQHDAERFFSIVKVGFKQKRKMLKNNLRGLAKEEKFKKILENLKIKETIRAEEVSLEQWLKITEALCG